MSDKKIVTLYVLRKNHERLRDLIVDDNPETKFLFVQGLCSALHIAEENLERVIALIKYKAPDIGYLLGDSQFDEADINLGINKFM